MKKSIFLIIISCLIVAFACKTTSSSIDKKLTIDDKVKINKEVEKQVVENTFQAIVVNQSPFTISIYEKIIKKGESCTHVFPLRESALYDGWGVDFNIPFFQDVFYLHREKIDITNRQTSVFIEKPRKNDIREAYIVVKNISKQSIRLTNGMGTIFPCCLEGRVNTQYAKKEHNIAPLKTAVYEILTQAEMKRGKVFISQGNQHHPLLENTSVKPGYVYTYEFNGKDAVKVDERPILKVGEPLWKQEDTTLSIEKVLRNDKFFYFVGKKRVLDADGNAYYLPYISCIDVANNVQWKSEDVSIDGYIQDAVVLEDGSILACGQSLVNDGNVGSLWLYSSDGTLQSVKNYSDLQVLSNVASLDNEVVVAGFDDEGELKLFKTTIAKSEISSIKQPLASFPNEILESTSSVSLLYDATSKNNTTSKALFVFFNLTNEKGSVLPSRLFKISESGKAEEVPLSDKIASISCSLISEKGVIYAGGESTLDEKTETVVLKIEEDKNTSHHTSSVFYQGSVPFSYIASMSLDEDSKTLSVGGVCRAKESSGVGGVPFMASFDEKSGKCLIYREYKSCKKQLLRSFVPSYDYGFVACFSSVIQEGELATYEKSLLVRMNASGQIRE